MERREEFLAWAGDPARSNEELFALEVLFERQGNRQEFPFKRPDVEAQVARHDARRLNPAYRPALSREHLEALADFADGTEYFETGYNDRPLRDLRALEFFPSITHVGISHAEVTDFSPLAQLPNLVRLSISEPALNALHLTGGLERWGAMAHLEHFSLRTQNPWLDLRPLAGWPALRELHYTGNILALAEVVALPQVEVAVLGEIHSLTTPLRDLRTFPAMPRVRRLVLGPTDSLEGIERYPSVLNLELSGTFRDLGPLAALSGVSFLKLTGGRFHDLAPVARMAGLRELKLVRERPIDLSPLSEAPALREVGMERCTIMKTELAALNAALALEECDFAAPEPRPLGPLVFVAVQNDTEGAREFEASLREPGSAARAAAYAGDVARAEADRRWRKGQVQQRLDALLGRGWGLADTGFVTIKRYEDVLRFREILQALREISAGARFPCSFFLQVEPHGDMSETLERMEEIAEAEGREGHWTDREYDPATGREDWEDYRKRRREEYEYLDREHRLRIQLEEGGAPINPGEFSPPRSEPEKDEEENDQEADEYEESANESLGEKLTFYVNLYENHLVVNQHWKEPAAYAYGEEPWIGGHWFRGRRASGPN